VRLFLSPVFFLFFFDLSRGPIVSGTNLCFISLVFSFFFCKSSSDWLNLAATFPCKLCRL